MQIRLGYPCIATSSALYLSVVRLALCVHCTLFFLPEGQWETKHWCPSLRRRGMIISNAFISPFSLLICAHRKLIEPADTAQQLGDLSYRERNLRGNQWSGNSSDNSLFFFPWDSFSWCCPGQGMPWTAVDIGGCIAWLHKSRRRCVLELT